MPAVPMPRMLNDDAAWNRPTCSSCTLGTAWLKSSSVTANSLSRLGPTKAVTASDISCTFSTVPRFVVTTISSMLPDVSRCSAAAVPAIASRQANARNSVPMGARGRIVISPRVSLIPVDKLTPRSCHRPRRTVRPYRGACQRPLGHQAAGRTTATGVCPFGRLAQQPSYAVGGSRL